MVQNGMSTTDPLCGKIKKWCPTKNTDLTHFTLQLCSWWVGKLIVWTEIMHAMIRLMQR